MARTFRERQKQGNHYGLQLIKNVYFRNQILKKVEIDVETKTKRNKTKNFNTNEAVRMLMFDQRKRISLTISDFTPDIVNNLSSFDPVVLIPQWFEFHPKRF